MYPDECVQQLLGCKWWIEDESAKLQRGSLITACLPQVTQVPWRIVPIGRPEDPREHGQATVRIEPFHISSAPVGASLPVAVFPGYPGGEFLVLRSKKRPAVVIATPGNEIPVPLQRGGAKWQYAPTLLVAPYFGAAATESRAGWSPALVERIRKCEYPQYVWDILPGHKGEESILRLDHLQPVGDSASSITIEPFRMSDDATRVLDDWLWWYFTGTYDKDGEIAVARSCLLG